MEDLSKISDEQLRAKYAELNSKVKSLQKKLDALKKEDRTDYAQHIIDKMFSEFKDGARWTNRMKELAKKEGYVYSPLGRIRHLPSAIMVNPKDKKLINRQIRRGSNAPIQGFASELAVKAARLTMLAYYDELPVLCKMMGIDSSEWELRVESSRMVHDASYYAVPYEMVIPFLHIAQYIATYGVARTVEQQFGIKFTIEPEVEFELTVNDGSSNECKWDWTIENLFDIVDASVAEGVELGIIDDPDDVKRRIFAPWKNKEVVKYLDKKYPLLGVHIARKIFTETKKHYASRLSSKE